jgi:hypothetical protein
VTTLTAVPAPVAAPTTGPISIWNDRAEPVVVPVLVPRESARPRLRNPKTLTAAILALVLLAAAVYVARPGTLGKPRKPPTGSLGQSPPSVVWAMPTAHGVQLAVVGVPRGGSGLALALPSGTARHCCGRHLYRRCEPGSGPRAQAVAQNLLLKRVGHYLVSTPSSLSALVDDLGGVDVQTEGAFTFGGHRIAAGTVKMTGPMASPICRRPARPT